ALQASLGHQARVSAPLAWCPSFQRRFSIMKFEDIAAEHVAEAAKALAEVQAASRKALKSIEWLRDKASHSSMSKFSPETGALVQPSIEAHETLTAALRMAREVADGRPDIKARREEEKRLVDVSGLWTRANNDPKQRLALDATRGGNCSAPGCGRWIESG